MLPAARGPAVGWTAGHSSHVRGNRDFQQFEIARGPDLVVSEAAGDVERLTRLQTDLLAVLEHQVNRSTEHVDELALADVVVPSRRLRHAVGPDRDLGAHLTATGGAEPA